MNKHSNSRAVNAVLTSSAATRELTAASSSVSAAGLRGESTSEETRASNKNGDEGEQTLQTEIGDGVVRLQRLEHNRRTTRGNAVCERAKEGKENATQHRMFIFL